MRDKSGKEVSAGEFFRRWGEGIKKATPLQLTKINFYGMGLVVAGIFIGLYATAKSKSWWLFTILCGSLILTIVSIVGNIQKFIIFKEMEQVSNQGLENEERQWRGDEFIKALKGRSQ